MGKEVSLGGRVERGTEGRGWRGGEGRKKGTGEEEETGRRHRGRERKLGWKGGVEKEVEEEQWNG